MKKRLEDQELLEAIINKQLEPFGKTMQDVAGKKDWFSKYVTTEEKEKEWFEWGMNFIMKNSKRLLLRNVHQAKREMNMILLNYGLTTKQNGRKKI